VSWSRKIWLSERSAKLRRASAAFDGQRAAFRPTFPACREYETVADWA
jgi:hypothetical protein